MRNAIYLFLVFACLSCKKSDENITPDKASFHSTTTTGLIDLTKKTYTDIVKEFKPLMIEPEVTSPTFGSITIKVKLNDIIYKALIYRTTSDKVTGVQMSRFYESNEILNLNEEIKIISALYNDIYAIHSTPTTQHITISGSGTKIINSKEEFKEILGGIVGNNFSVNVAWALPNIESGIQYNATSGTTFRYVNK